MKVSVVTPSFNQGEFIERTLRSVATQEGVTHEHFVFDAGSSDATVGILRGFRPAVRWVSEPDRGQAHAVNKGIAASDGEIIGWINSDDVYYPGALRRVVEFFSSAPDVDVLYGMADHIDRDDRAFEPYPTAAWSFEALKRSCFICQPAAFFRRRVVEAHGPLDETLHYCMDYEYWIRLAKAGARFAYLERKLAGSRLYPETKTLAARVRAHEEINEMLARSLGRVPLPWIAAYAYAVVDASTPGRGRLSRRIHALPEMARAFSRWGLRARGESDH